MEKIAFCGLVCSECPVYVATQTGDMELKEKLAREYSAAGCQLPCSRKAIWMGKADSGEFLACSASFYEFPQAATVHNFV